MSDEDQVVNQKDHTALLSRLAGNELPEAAWMYNDFAAAEDAPMDMGTGLVSLSFMRAAISRRKRFCLALAMIGLLAGFALRAAFPLAYQASTSIILTYGPYENITTAPSDNQAIAASRSVARLALSELGLKQDVTTFLASYTVMPLSTRVLEITIGAPSAQAAINRANAVARAFLQFRAGLLESQQHLALMSLDQQMKRVTESVSSLSTQIRTLSAEPATPTRLAKLSALRAELGQSNSALTALEQSADGGQASTATALAVKGSRVLDAATLIPFSRVKYALLYPAAGLILGLALGLGLVTVEAIVSDRLRRREDVAKSVGAPVKLSVGTIRPNRWLPGHRELAAAADSVEIQRIVSHLLSVVPTSTRGVATLAVVPADTPQVAALSLASLAVACAKQGKQVIVADLCSGSPAARFIGVQDTGTHTVRVDEARLMVAIPPRDDMTPIGPRRSRSRPSQAPAQQPYSTQGLAAAYASADLLLTLASLDPSLGGEHLATWATTAVVMVTAGKSSAARIRAVGEMLRHAGMRPISAVLVGADKTDETVGMARAPGAEYQPGRL